MKTTTQLSFMLLLSVFVSCKNDKTTNDENSKKQTITHNLGTTEVVENPQRVVVFDYGALETLDELGIKIIGTAKQNLPSHLQKYKTDASVEDVGSVKEANFEKLSELNPDLIIISGRLQEAYPELSKIAPTISLGVDTKDYLNSFKKNTNILAHLFNKKTEADKLLKNIETKIATTKEKLTQLEGKALVVLFNKGKFSAYGKGSRFGFIHDVLGIKEAMEGIEIGTHGQSISNEFIHKTNPDYLFVVDRGAVVNQKSTDTSEIENLLIQQTKAYKNGKIIYLTPEIWYLSGGGIISVNKMIDEISAGF